jgi:hypothetical protein
MRILRREDECAYAIREYTAGEGKASWDHWDDQDVRSQKKVIYRQEEKQITDFRDKRIEENAYGWTGKVKSYISCL